MSQFEGTDFTRLAKDVKAWGKELGFQQVAITDTDVSDADQRLSAWLAQRHHGSMRYLEQNRELRRHPNQLVPNTLRIIMVRMNYLPPNARIAATLQNKALAYISRYALGRDYHKVVRKRLAKLAQKIKNAVGDFNYRPFADSAPVFEKPLAAKAGIGWMGKHTLILNRQAGSWFFLGCLYTDLPLPLDQPVTDHCGSCRACLDICPTQAIIAPYQLDARRCISYLTIENKGDIPVALRPLIGNRIFGCDDCQMICPWNKFAKFTTETDFQPRHQLDHAQLFDLFAWSEAEFLTNTAGSPIRRAGYIGWLRNIAVALGNAPTSSAIIDALRSRQAHASSLVREHVAWALARHQSLR